MKVAIVNMQTGEIDRTVICHDPHVQMQCEAHHVALKIQDDWDDASHWWNPDTGDIEPKPDA